MNKKLKLATKLLMSMSLIGSLLVPVQAKASNTDTQSQNITVNETKELMNKFPTFKESLKKYSTGKLVTRGETYVKFVPKNKTKQAPSQSKELYNFDTVKKDYEVKNYTKDEFQKEVLKENSIRSKRSVGSLEVNPCYWLKLDLQVYQGMNGCDYMAYNFCSWLTRPIVRFQDGIGISFSNGLIAARNANTRHAIYNFANPYSPDGGHKQLSVEINSHGNGVLATGYLARDFSRSFPNLKEYHEFMVSTGVTYNNSSVRKGWITGHYLHKQLAIGGIGMDQNGVPNLSIGGSKDTHSGRRFVSR